MFQPNLHNLKRELSRPVSSKVDIAFQLLLHNRVARGGIVANGGGILNKGENGNGVFSRWYPATLVNRIYCIHGLRSQISFKRDDGLKTLAELVHDRSSAFLIDPPYSGAGKAAGARLYRHSEIDHGKLFQAAMRLKGQFLLTYEDCDEIRLASNAAKLQYRVVRMRTTHNLRSTEVLISRRMDWFDRPSGAVT